MQACNVLNVWKKIRYYFVSFKPLRMMINTLNRKYFGNKFWVQNTSNDSGNINKDCNIVIKTILLVLIICH